MKKQIVCGALAAIGCFSGAACAQGSVTLYGTVDSGFQYSDVGGVKTASAANGTVIPNRWGLTGQEPLGGGIFAVFKMENGFNVNNGTALQNGALFGREAWVGLKSSLGQLQLGVNNTAINITLLQDSLGYGWGTAANNFVFIPTLRSNNSVRYSSPEVGNFTMTATYALGANGSATLPRTLGNTASVGFRYATKNFAADADFMTQVYSPAKVVTPGSMTSTGNYSLFAVKYDFGFLTAGAIFQMHRGGSASGSYSGYANVNNNFYEIAARIPINVSGLLFSFGQYKDLANSAGNATSYGIRYDYPLSKQTILYAGVAAMRNGSAASFSVNSTVAVSVPVSVPGSSVTAGIIGMTHLF
jgi:predicted porin